jgi:hypothetical protein
MGLSRPGVESTLFRARRRLGEEYDELVTGQRCVRIQSIIAAAGDAVLGTRDQRRLARHISHCQPCRRMALAAGLDIASLPRTPVRRAIDRVAGFLPLPAFLRSRFFGEQMVPLSEPMASGVTKAVAVAATVLVAGVGAGVAPHVSGGEPPALKEAKAKPAAKSTQASAASGSSNRARRPVQGAAPATKRTKVKAKVRRNTKRNSSGLGSTNKAAPQTSTPTSSAPATTPTKPATKPAATNPSGGSSTPTRQVTSTPTAPSVPRLPEVQLPPLDGVTGTQTGNQVNQVVQDTTQTVNDTVGTVEDTVDQVTGGLLNP